MVLIRETFTYHFSNISQLRIHWYELKGHRKDEDANPQKQTNNIGNKLFRIIDKMYGSIWNVLGWLYKIIKEYERIWK